MNIFESINISYTDAFVYLISIILIIAVLRNRFGIIVVGSIILAGYSYFFLDNLLFAALQFLIAWSAVWCFFNVSKFECLLANGAMIFAVFFGLVLYGEITNAISLIAAIGLLSIAVGLNLPTKYKHMAMVFGGTLLTFYSYKVGAGAEVFLFLNFFFALINLIALLRMKNTIPTNI